MGRGASGPRCHQGRPAPAGPGLVPRRGFRQRRAQLLLQRERQHRRRSIRRGMPAILHAGGSLFVVALGNLTDPVCSVARGRRKFRRRAPLGEQPEKLPPGALVGLFGRPVASLQFGDGQMGLEMDMSGHAQILPSPILSPYHLVSGPRVVAAVIDLAVPMSEIQRGECPSRDEAEATLIAERSHFAWSIKVFAGIVNSLPDVPLLIVSSNRELRVGIKRMALTHYECVMPSASEEEWSSALARCMAMGPEEERIQGERIDLVPDS